MIVIAEAALTGLCVDSRHKYQLNSGHGAYEHRRLALMVIVEKNGAVQFAVRVVPRASKSEVVGEHDGALKVRIASPPVDGAANAELIKLLAKLLKIPKSDVEIVGGESSRSKQVRVSGVTSIQIDAILKTKT